MEIKFVREMDELGRLVIPIDLRRYYGIRAKDKLCIIAKEEGILIVPEKCTKNSEDTEEQ